MDYGRLALFMAAATFVMAFGTHLWCWAYHVVERAVFRRKLSQICETWDEDRLEDEAIERRRAAASRYMTWEQAMGDFRGGVPLDDILDRLNGEFPPRAADIQFGSPNPPPSGVTGPPGQNGGTGLSGPVLASVLGVMAILACLYGVGLKPEGVEMLIKSLREKHDQPKPQSGGGA